MTNRAYIEAEWFQQLVAESKRDLVFVFNIAAGAFGGPKPPPAPVEIPDLLERAATALLAAGCSVGFGDPDSNDWVVPERLEVAPGERPAAIASFFAESPEEARFLAFAHRATRDRCADA